MSEKYMYPSSKGFTFAEILIVVAIMGIIGSVALKNMTGSNNKVKYEESILELQKLKEAIIGDENARSNNERVSFGFIGDIGGLPLTLDALVSRGSLGAATLDTAKIIAYGWMGPYLDVAFTGDNTDFKTDGWGNAYIYSTTQFANGPGDTVVAKISSLGADGSVGGTGYDSDIFVEIKKEQVQAEVTGSVMEISGNPVLAATARIYQPDGLGGLTSKASFTDASGNYTIKNVSQGVRAVTVQLASGGESEGYRVTLGGSFITVRTIGDIGSIILVGTAVATGAGGVDLDFEIQSKLGEDVSIEDFKAVYTPFDGITGPRYEDQIAGNKTPWTFVATLGGSNVLLSTLNSYTPWTLKDNATVSITLSNFQDDLGANSSVQGFDFTTSFYTSTGEVFTVGPFTVGGAPVFNIVGDVTARKGIAFFDVINNTGGDDTLIDLKLVYTPYNAGSTGPEFDETKVAGATVWTEGAGGTIGSGIQLSTVAAFTSTFWGAGQTLEIRFAGIISLTNNRTTDITGSVLTTTLYMLSGAEYVIGPVVAL